MVKGTVSPTDMQLCGTSTGANVLTVSLKFLENNMIYCAAMHTRITIGQLSTSIT